MAQSQGPQLTLLSYFKPNATPSKVWQELNKKQVPQNPNKIYRMIEMKVDGYCESENPTEKVVVQELRDILQDNYVTPQLLFNILSQVVNDDNSNPKVSLIIVKAICSIDAHVAFEEEVAARSKVGQINAHTPFEIASEKGYTSFVGVMSDELVKHNKGYNEKTNSDKDAPQKRDDRPVIRTDPKIAFNLAAGNLQLGVLKLFLTHEAFKKEKLADVRSLKAAISRIADKALTSVSGTENSREKVPGGPDLEAFEFILGETQLTEDHYREIWAEAVTKKADVVIQYLLGTKLLEFATQNSAQVIIEKGTAKMWELWSKSVGHRLKDILENGHLLHAAVEFRQTDIVKAILDGFGRLIAVGRKKREGTEDEYLEYAVEMLNNKHEALNLQESSSCMEIRNLLLKAMIRSSSSNLGIKEIKAILRRARIDVNAMCLHLSHVNTGEQSFTEYVECLQAQDDDQNKIFEFESILKYAKFPDLNTQTSNQIHDVAANMRSTHMEIRIMFEWLRKRGVTEVLEISVPDRLFCPHSDDDIANCVDDFAVRVLKWRKLDLYLGSIKRKDHLRELHLYSSGNPSVHDQWCRELPEFLKLRRLYVYVVTNILSNERVESAKTDLQSRLGGIKPNLKISVVEFDWDMDIRGKVYRKLDEITNDVVGPNLSAFIDKYRSAVTARRNSDQKKIKTRIALIDSGVVIVGGKRNGYGGSSGHNSNDRSDNSGADKHGWQANNQASRLHYDLPNKDKQPLNQDEEAINEPEGQQYRTAYTGWTDELANRVDAGKSFVTTGDNEEQVWWHASEPHGTQMARLICSVDPLCRLFIAKVAETRKPGISAELVAEAIDWAIDQKVDIISLSLVTYTASKSLKSAIQRAEGNDIVILSSSVDEGFKEVKDTLQQSGVKHNVLTIAACDQWGNLLDRSQKSGYDYCFVGNDVEVGQVPFLKSPESISGSSVATAIAAGVVSLIIAFCRLANEDQPKMDGRWRTNITKERLGVMVGADHKYVVLEQICGDKKELSNVDFMHEVKTNFTGRGT